ncbi:hypothetical protein FCL38_07475 [Pseudoduganella umbonata]|nr:hypothetical protein FCL38_07475 [Pseudoduganella umbonata]
MVYAACLAGAAFNHARILLGHGLWWDYGGVHPFYAAFWTSLTFFDALAVLLLLARPRAGVALTALIIVADVLVNTTAALAYRFDLPSFAAQCGFLFFVLATVTRAWHGCAPADSATLQH